MLIFICTLRATKEEWDNEKERGGGGTCLHFCVPKRLQKSNVIRSFFYNIESLPLYYFVINVKIQFTIYFLLMKIFFFQLNMFYFFSFNIKDHLALNKAKS